MKKGFDNEKYVREQSQCISKRIEQTGGRLYLEFGGKLFDDLHASRVLPGFDPETKIRMLQQLKDTAEVIMVISADDIQRNKIRADIGITYGLELMRTVDNIRSYGLLVSSIVITQFNEQPAALAFAKRLQMRGERVYIHRFTRGYPTDVNMIVSEEGYGKNPYIETTRQLVVVTAPGPGSGKLATCLNQLYHESKRGIKASYAKYETFPIWNLPLKHPVNVAYEAATADLKDANMIDYFHLEAYGKMSVNYNRDLEVFPIVKSILKKISSADVYLSPTDMGVNMAGFAIVDDEVCCEASRQEVIRRYYRASLDHKLGLGSGEAVSKIELLMNELNITPTYRHVVQPAIDRGEQVNVPVTAIELSDGTIVTGRESNLLTASSSALLNALKVVANIDDKIQLISPIVIEPIMKLNKHIIKTRQERMTLEETLVALSMSATTNGFSRLAFDCLDKLKGCQAHSTFFMREADMNIIRRLGIQLTCESKFESDELYME